MGVDVTARASTCEGVGVTARTEIDDCMEMCRSLSKSMDYSECLAFCYFMLIWFWGRYPFLVGNHRVLPLIGGSSGHLRVSCLGSGVYMFDCGGVLVVWLSSSGFELFLLALMYGVAVLAVFLFLYLVYKCLGWLD